MKVLLLHNFYQQAGGEDRVFADEAALLASRGHEVFEFTRHNDAIERMPLPVVAAKTLWNCEIYRELRALIRRIRPDVMHCTNTFPLISPAAYYAAHAEGVPVVQSLHNYRLLCPGGYLMREGRVCEACIGGAVPWRSILHGCYRDSRAGSTVVTTMLGIHRWLGTWAKQIQCYIALTEFARQKFVASGFPEDKIRVKPNFVSPAPVPGAGVGGYALFVGRLSPEKGIPTLLQAWRQIPESIPLKILGDGPLSPQVEEAALTDDRIEYLGHCDHAAVDAAIGDAAMLIVPSLWYEGLPKTIVEAYAKGTPVIASQLGSLAELVRDGKTGRLVTAGAADELASTVAELMSDEDRLQLMREAARHEFEERYTADANYDTLLSIYQDVIAKNAPVAARTRSESAAAYSDAAMVASGSPGI